MKDNILGNRDGFMLESAYPNIGQAPDSTNPDPAPEAPRVVIDLNPDTPAESGLEEPQLLINLDSTE